MGMVLILLGGAGVLFVQRNRGVDKISLKLINEKE